MAGRGFREAQDGELLSDAFRDFVRQDKVLSGDFGAVFKAYTEALLQVAKAYGDKELTPEEREEAREALYKINARGGAEAIEGVAMARDTTYKGNPNAPADATLRIAEYWDRKQGTAPEPDKAYAQTTIPAKPKKRNKPVPTPRQVVERKFRKRFGDFGISSETFHKQLAQVPDDELGTALEYFRAHASGDEDPLAVLLRVKKGEYRQ